MRYVQWQKIAKHIKIGALSDPLRFANVLNNCISTAYYKNSRKVANLVLLLKPGRTPDDPSAYCPLYMLDTCGKLLEKILVHRLRSYLTGNAISDK